MIRLLRAPAKSALAPTHQTTKLDSRFIVESDTGGETLLTSYLNFKTGISTSELEQMARTRRIAINRKRIKDLNVAIFPGDEVAINRPPPRPSIHTRRILQSGSGFHVESDGEHKICIKAYDQKIFHAFESAICAPYVPLINGDVSVKENRSFNHGRAATEKSYWAIVCGQPAVDKGIINHPIMISSDDSTLKLVNPSRISPYERSRVFNAETNYEKIDNIDNIGSLLRIIVRHSAQERDQSESTIDSPEIIRGTAALQMEIEQIRVHLACGLKTPILGDRSYGITSYRTLHLQGWGHYIDFTKYGMKSLPGGMPLFLLLRKLHVQGQNGIDTTTVTNPLPEMWRMFLKSVGINPPSY